MKVLRSAAVLAVTLACLSQFAFSEPAAIDKTLPGKGDASKSYQIKNKKHGDLLRPKDADGSDGVPLVLYPATLWKCLTWKLSPVGGTEFTVQNHFTGKTFALSAKEQSGAVVQVALPKDTAKAVPWRFVKLADGSYRIADPKSGKVLTAVKSEKGDDVRISLLPWAETDQQKWELKEIDPAKLTM